VAAEKSVVHDGAISQVLGAAAEQLGRTHALRDHVDPEPWKDCALRDEWRREVYLTAAIIAGGTVGKFLRLFASVRVHSRSEGADEWDVWVMEAGFLT
jgi:hypothetical protein